MLIFAHAFWLSVSHSAEYGTMSREDQEQEDRQMALMDQEITSLLPKIKAGKKLVDMLDRDCLTFDVTMSKVRQNIYLFE